MANKKEKKEQKGKPGRPTTFTQALADKICARIASGESVRSISRDEHMPCGATIYNWLLDKKHLHFLEQYARARDIQAELMFEEILEIADDGSNDFMTIQKGEREYNVEDKEVTNRSRLRVDSRKWYLSKVLPKKFGDKLDLTSDGKPIPLLNVLHNDGDKENSGTQEAD